MNKTIVGLLGAAALSVATVPLAATSASAAPGALSAGPCSNTGFGNYVDESAQLLDPAVGKSAGSVALYRDAQNDKKCISVFVNLDDVSTVDSGPMLLTVSWSVDDVAHRDSIPLRRVDGAHFEGNVDFEVGQRVSDVTAKVDVPRSTLKSAPYTEEVSCTSVGIREVERQVVRKVPTIENVTSTVTVKPSSAERYSARAALKQKNISARKKYIVPAEKAAAKGNTVRANKLRAKHAKVRAANVAAYRKAVAPSRVKVVTPKVVYRDTVVTEKINETYDKTGVCTISGERLTQVTTYQTYAGGFLSTPILN